MARVRAAGEVQAHESRVTSVKTDYAATPFSSLTGSGHAIQGSVIQPAKRLESDPENESPISP
jgi:hypothetical protein